MSHGKHLPAITKSTATHLIHTIRANPLVCKVCNHSSTYGAKRVYEMTYKQLFVVCGWLVYAGYSQTMNYLNLLLRWPGLALLLVLIALLIRRKQHRKFSLFVAYLAFSILAAIVRIIASRDQLAYFVAYWSAEVIFATLALLVIRQVFHRVFAVEYRLFRWMRFLLPVTVVLILGFSFYEGVQVWNGHSQIRQLIAMINGFDIGVHAFQAALLFLLLVLRLLFPARWLRYEFGILTGYAFNSIVNICGDLLWLKYGSGYRLFYTYGPPMAFMLTTLIWLWVFSAPPEAIAKMNPSPDKLHDPPDQQHHSFVRIRQ